MEEEEALGPPQLRPSGRRNTRPLDRRALEGLSTKAPEEILMRLASDGGGLKELVKKPTLEETKLELLLDLIDKSFNPRTLAFQYEQIKSVLNIILADPIFMNLTLYQFLKPKRSEDKEFAIARSMLNLVNTAMTISPTEAVPRVIQFQELLAEKIRPFDDVELQAQLGRFKNALDKDAGRHRGADHPDNARPRGMRLNEDTDQPEDTFRALPLIPSQHDLTADEGIFVRRNRDSGRYANLEEYLDIQFRLFRADFIIPLRESIDKFLGSHDAANPRESGRGVRVYHDVQLVRPVCSDKELSYRISFDVSAFPNVNWRTSQRLKYGSLLCLSSDGFQTYLCAVVHERDAPLLSNGLVDVVFVLDRDQLHQVMEIPRHQRFVMVESPAYFEAYRHVLHGLKNLNDHNFPFTRYIVRCEPDVNPPRYLQRGGANVRYDFRPLLNDKFIVKDKRAPADDLADTLADLGMDDLDPEEVAMNMEAVGVDVMTGANWPTQGDLKLDETQYVALQNALTKEFALVQGPPGTGKTYLGLKIMKMLLHNAKAWNDPAQKRPVLVVCYTNHALDQFLEGVLDFFKGSLVRVGARSNSERLKDMTLTHYRTRARLNRKIPMETHEAKTRVRVELRQLRNNIHEKAAMLEIAEQEIVKEEFLQEFIAPNHIRGFKQSLGSRREDSAMLKWLKLEELQERLKYQAEHRLDNLPSVRVLHEDRSHLSSAQPAHRADDVGDYEEDDEEEDEDEETLSRAEAFNDSRQFRRLDADDDFDDDDEYLQLGLDFDDLNLEREEGEMERLRRRQREIESETQRLKTTYVALDISGFCTDAEELDVRDLTAMKRSRAKDKEVSDNLHKLLLRQKRRLQTLLRSVDTMTGDEADQVANIWSLKQADRWRLYRHWADLYCRQMRGEIRDDERNYFDKARKYREILDQEDRSILQDATVIGMTTTGAARYQSILHAIGPRVVVVEEAAEVFEAHVVATLSDQCQHLILIGDHKQLRPNPTVYDLAKKANLDVSLFERMVRNGFHYDCLGFQHRMRPEISNMMKLPDLYPNLQDHEMVKRFEPVKGVSHNVYYISHSQPEDRDAETKSFSNHHEAEYLVALCDYLLKQGYRHHQITVITPYSGQVHTIATQMSKRKLEGVRVSSVDNFQGEENDIILLSLVRSNNDNDIGFLKTDNRICVALSRAKMGMYVIGNFEVLQNSSTLLKSVVDRAIAQRIMGDGLPLSCQNHPRKDGIVACTAKDFKKAPEGGCTERCDVRLNCGHRCPRTCHPNVGHDDVDCLFYCTRQCQRCGQRCLDGGHLCCEHTHCLRETEKVIPRCGHTQLVPCGKDPMTVLCKEACRERLPCGHPCQNECGQPCSRQCQVKVAVTSPDCQHEHHAPCSQRDTAPCAKPCGQELVCGHKCSGTCGECRNGRLHVPCDQRCRKILVCGHDCQAACCQCPPCSAPCQNRCSHSRCDKKCGEACVSCAMTCDWRCPHKKCTTPCGEPCNRDRCDQPCPKRLPDCGHPCIGLCGETCPPVCRVCDPEILADSVFGLPDDDDRFVLLEDCCHTLEVTSLDRWVDISRGDNREEAEDNSSDGAAASGETSQSRIVKLPECPQCKTPIRRNLRYGNVVKEALAEIEIIKQRCRGNQRGVEELQRKVDQAKTRVPQNLKPQVEELFRQGEVPCESRLATQFYQISLVVDTDQLLRQVTSAITRWPDKKDSYRSVQADVDHLITWSLRPRNIMSDQERFDVRQELQRLKILLHLLHCRHAISSDELEVHPRLMRRLAACIRQLQTSGPVAEKELEEGRQLKEDLKDVVEDPYTALTEGEREEIIKAIKLPTGSWYACPRGHYYVIGECGRPTEVASCPECRSAIGGENHALVGGNRQAPEFDNAEGPVWSEAADLELALRLQEEEFANWH